MLRRGIVPLSFMLMIGVGLVGCSKDTASSTSTTAAGVTVSTAATPTTATTGATTKGSTPAASNEVAITVGDTAGLNGPMTMTVAPKTAKAGKVTFTVKNTGTITHEVVVLALTGSETWDKLPVTADKVSEDASKGEVEVEVGETKSFEADLTTGKYALVCNIEKHYAMGMRSEFTVS